MKCRQQNKYFFRRDSHLHHTAKYSIPQNTPTGIPRVDSERRPSQVGVEVDNYQGRQQGQHLEDDEDDARLGRQRTPLAQVGLRCTRAFAAAASCRSHALYQENFHGVNIV